MKTLKCCGEELKYRVSPLNPKYELASCEICHKPYVAKVEQEQAPDLGVNTSEAVDTKDRMGR